MADTPEQLAEKLKAALNKPTPSFEAPTSNEPQLATVDSVNIQDTVSEGAKGEAAVSTKPSPDNGADNPQMANLIKEATKRNQVLTNRQRLDMLPDLSHKAATFRTHSAKVLQILKDHGMDSQQAEKALTALLTLE